jgi:hypothetical protein
VDADALTRGGLGGEAGGNLALCAAPRERGAKGEEGTAELGQLDACKAIWSDHGRGAAMSDVAGRGPGPGAKPPHPATVAQRRPAFGAAPARPPHPATAAEPRPAFGAPPATSALRSAIQRTSLGKKELSEVASLLNESHSGKKDSRNTQAVVVTSDDKVILFTQREYSSFDSAIEEAEESYQITIDDRVIGDSRKEDEGIHAEMLAISWWLQGNIKKPKSVGVSQGVCARCGAVLKYYKIPYEPEGGNKTQNWVHPHRHAGMTPPEGALQKIPQKVTKGREYFWD